MLYHFSLESSRPPPYSETPEPYRKDMDGAKKSLKEKLSNLTLPWQARILAWFLLIASIALSVIFTTFYGISFGDAACKQWLSSLVLSFLMDICLTQPIKVRHDLNIWICVIWFVTQLFPSSNLFICLFYMHQNETKLQTTGPS